MKRRGFLRTSSLAGGAVLSSCTGAEALAQEASSREFYELRTYETQTGNRKAILNEYLEKAFIPAMNRLGSRPIGVFTVVSGSNALNLFVLVPHPSLESFLTAPAKLAGDTEDQKAGAAYLSTTIDNPAYTRYESALLLAFRSTSRRCACRPRTPARSRASSSCACTKATTRRRRSRRSHDFS